MTLGEKIYELRTKQGLSQGDLAEQLNVSRQSISKWETGSSTPDLDKLIKMSQLFQVTLDELVLDKKPDAEKTAGSTDSFSEPTQDKIESPFSHERQQSHEPHFPTRKIAGTILLCMGFLTFILALLLNGSWSSLILAVPFLLCGIICFVFRKHAGLWCTWFLFCLIDLYLRWGSIISWQAALGFFRFGLYRDNTIAVATSMIMLLFLVGMIIVTALFFSKKTLTPSISRILVYLVGWVTYLFLPQLLYKAVGSFAYPLVFTLISWIEIAAFILLMIFTIRFGRSMLRKGRE
ncbi:MAG: helix-turn-helix domain-containing protein [Lachnospiraceae bacterium]|nr:helix-turn-helix domain-containing protein [Lachnospiraceae bacterium]